MRSTKYLLTATLVLILGSLALAQNSSSTANPFHWKGTLAAGKTLAIKNINGDITAEGTPGDQVEITANKSGEGADQVRIDVVQDSDGIAVCDCWKVGWVPNGARRWKSLTPAKARQCNSCSWPEKLSIQKATSHV